MTPSPYSPGRLPSIFAGRVRERDALRTRFAHVAQYGEYVGPLVAFHGPRGVGKTSLLRQAQRGAERDGFVSAWTACRDGQPFLADVVDRVGAALARHDASDSRRLSDTCFRLHEVSAQLGLPGASVSATFQAGASSRHPRPALSLIEDVLADASRAIRSVGGAGLLLFLDELHAADRDDLGVLLNAMQNLEGRRDDVPLSVISAGLPSTPDVITRAATFGERGSFHALSRLSEDDAREAVEAPARVHGVDWTSDALAEVLKQADGFPFLLQLVADVAWETIGPARGDVIGIEGLQQASAEVRRRLNELFALRWNAASTGEQAMLVAMATVARNGDSIERRAVAATMNVTSRQISVVRDRLIAKGLIESVGHGLLRFTIPGFGTFVRDDQGDD